jgi:hypothetical protein
MVEERIYNWISENYGDIDPSTKHDIALTFELYWDQFNFRYAEIKTLEIHKPQTHERTNCNSKRA